MPQSSCNSTERTYSNELARDMKVMVVVMLRQRQVVALLCGDADDAPSHAQRCSKAAEGQPGRVCGRRHFSLLAWKGQSG